MKLKDVKAKAKLSSDKGISITDKGYLHYKNTGEILEKEVKDKKISKDKRAWLKGYRAGITEVQVRYAKKGLFSRKNKVPDVGLEDWQEEGIKRMLKNY